MLLESLSTFAVPGGTVSAVLSRNRYGDLLAIVHRRGGQMRWTAAVDGRDLGNLWSRLEELLTCHDQWSEWRDDLDFLY